MSIPVHVIATFKAKPGKESEAEKLLQSIIPATHQESGCVTYAFHRRADQPGTYYFIEKWRSQADLDQHLSAPHIKPALARAEELFAVADIGILEPVLAGDSAKNTLFK